jgi:hypothetical protein
MALVLRDLVDDGTLTAETAAVLEARGMVQPEPEHAARLLSRSEQTSSGMGTWRRTEVLGSAGSHEECTEKLQSIGGRWKYASGGFTKPTGAVYCCAEPGCECRLRIVRTRIATRDEWVIQQPAAQQHSHSTPVLAKARANSTFPSLFAQRVDGMINRGATPSDVLNECLLAPQDDPELASLIPANLELEQLQHYKRTHGNKVALKVSSVNELRNFCEARHEAIRSNARYTRYAPYCLYLYFRHSQEAAGEGRAPAEREDLLCAGART